MKYIEKFGGWVLDTKLGLLFGCVLLLIFAGISAWEIYKAPLTVRLSEKEFGCVAAEPDGLATRCIDYRRFR